MKVELVILYKEFDTDPNPEDASDDGKRRVARASRVFNASQFDGMRPLSSLIRSVPSSALPHRPVRNRRKDRSPAATAPITVFQNIQMPSEDAFCGTATMSGSEGYYATLVHELTHWSGAKHRLNREFGKRFGDQAYAAEDLVAEIGAAFLCAELQITQKTWADHAQYLAQWLTLLKSDSKAIFAAAFNGQAREETPRSSRLHMACGRNASRTAAHSRRLRVPTRRQALSAAICPERRPQV